jgi:hypothetical protein
MINRKQIRDQIETLIKINHTKSINLKHELICVDLSNHIYHLLNDEAKNAVMIKADSLVHQYSEPLHPSGDQIEKLQILIDKLGIKSASTLPSGYIRRIAQVNFFGYTTDIIQAGNATLSLVNMINDLASMNAIRASLSTLSSCQLSNGKVVIFSYLAIDQKLEQYVNLKYKDITFPEGGIPKEYVG